MLAAWNKSKAFSAVSSKRGGTNLNNLFQDSHKESPAEPKLIQNFSKQFM